MTTVPKELLIQWRAVMLEACGNRCNVEYNPCQFREAANSMQAAIDQPEPKPVGEACSMPGTQGGFTMASFNSEAVPIGAKLYTRPVPDLCRIELVTALHGLASDFENSLYAFGNDAEALKKAKGDIAHAMGIAARWNYNGTSPAPANPLTDDQIDAITVAQWGEQIGAMLAAYRAYARAIEATHKIGPKS